MNREEILEKSRKSVVDEGLENAQKRGNDLGRLLFSLVSVFVVIFNVRHGESYALPMTFIALFVASDHLAAFRFTKKKYDLIMALLTGVTCILALTVYVREVLGIL